jgi:CheY-like chemotaxis protein
LIKIGEFRPHVIVLDVYMPQLDGIEVCKRLHKMPTTSECRVIVTSGTLTPQIEAAARAAGATACLQKPLSMSVIREALNLPAGATEELQR